MNRANCSELKQLRDKWVSSDEGAAAWLEAQVREFEGPLLLYATRLLDNEDDAHDAVQETFVRLCSQERSAIDSYVGHWLFCVCRNAALTLRKSTSRIRPMTSKHLEASWIENPLDKRAELDETVAEVLRILDSLPEREQEAIWLKLFQGFSYREISEITGLTISHVGVLIHTGLKKIRNRISADQKLIDLRAEGGS